jgi:hypothetical protein
MWFRGRPDSVAGVVPWPAWFLGRPGSVAGPSQPLPAAQPTVNVSLLLFFEQQTHIHA